MHLAAPVGVEQAMYAIGTTTTRGTPSRSDTSALTLSKADRRRGAAIIRWQYDQYGREVGTSMFDSSERPVRSRI